MSIYVNTGVSRRKRLTVTRTINGISYSNDFNFMSSFPDVSGLILGGYPPIESDLALSLMPEEDYLSRLNAFKAYVENYFSSQGKALPSGTNLLSGAYVVDYTLCPAS